MNRAVLSGILIGLGVGVGLGCLLAPRSGSETRAQWLKKMRSTANDLQRQSRGYVKSTSDLIDTGREQLGKQSDGLLNAVNAGKKAYLKTVG